MTNPSIATPQSAQNSDTGWVVGWMVGDLRSLALWRIGLGIAVLCSVFNFLSELDLYYSDQGVLPRLLFLKTPALCSRYSILLGCSNTAQIGFLAVLELAAAISLVMGYRARLSAALCWLLHWSFLNRNPMICDRGDMELGLLLFYAMFLPLGSRWAYRADGAANNSHRSWVWLALLAQLSQIYLFAGLLKHGAAWTGRGDGLQLSLECALFARPTALWLASLPGLKALNYLVIVAEVLVGLCLWGPSRLRQAAVLSIAFFHVLVGLIFDLGGFPWIGAMGCVVLLPTSFWQGPGRPIDAWLTRQFDLSKAKPEAKLGTNPLALNLWASTITAYVFLCNLCTCTSLGVQSLPQPLRYFGQVLNLEQHWELFAPFPPFDGWFVLEADTANLLHPGHKNLDRPDSPTGYYPRYRIKMLLATTLFHQNDAIKAQICRAIAHNQNATASKLKLSFWVREVDQNGLKSPISVRHIWEGSAIESTPVSEGKNPPK
jgi:hypothetical protein